MLINHLEQRSEEDNSSQNWINKMVEQTALCKHRIRILLEEHRKVFACSDTELGVYKYPVKLELRNKDITPNYCKPRIVPYALRDWLDKKLKEMVDTGLVELCMGSPFCSPVHIVKKKEVGKYRLTVDYRYLNSLLKQNRWPIPNIREVLEELSGSKYFSVADCRSGFWQLKLNQASRDMTSFACRGRQYRWKVLPMGLSVSPGIFQSVMMQILGELIFNGVIVYIDDIIIYSNTAETHYALLKMVVERLLKAGIRLHPEKSIFGVEMVEYLGYEVGAFGYRPIKSKVESILEMSRPTTKTECKAFIGAIGFYTQVLPMLQHTLAPLHAITGARKPFDWGDEQEEAFNAAKQILGQCSPLAFPSHDDRAQLILTTDASDMGYGGVLSEKTLDGTEKPLGYYSGTFRDSQINWRIREKELYSFYFGCEYFYPQLVATHFIWRTDNKSLSTLADASLRVKTSGSPNARLLRWLDFLSMFDFSTELLKGTSPEMNLADCLSRLHKNEKKTPVETIALLKMPFWTQTGIPLADFVVKQEGDIHLIQRSGPWKKLKRYKEVIIDGLRKLEIDGKLLVMVPEDLQLPLIEYYHGPSHASFKRIRNEIDSLFIFPGRFAKVSKFLKSCERCQAVWAKRKPRNNPVKTTTANHPWNWAQIDLIGPLPTTLNGNKYILTYVDEFTSWVELRCLEDKTAESVLMALNKIFTVRGPPLNIQSDNGAEFINNLVQAFLKDLGIYHNKICPYKPTTNGLVERMNRKVKQQMQLLPVSDLTWDEDIPTIQLTLNNMKLSCGHSAPKTTWVGSKSSRFC